jgi:hypothetical protein
VDKQKNMRLKSTSIVERGSSEKNITDVQLVCIPFSMQSRSCSIQELLVPVVDSHNNPQKRKSVKTPEFLVQKSSHYIRNNVNKKACKILTNNSWRMAISSQV